MLVRLLLMPMQNVMFMLMITLPTRMLVKLSIVNANRIGNAGIATANAKLMAALLLMMRMLMVMLPLLMPIPMLMPSEDAVRAYADVKHAATHIASANANDNASVHDANGPANDTPADSNAMLTTVP